MEPAQLAKVARESLAAALNAIQSCDDAPDELFDQAEVIAQTITILRKIERSGGTLMEGRDVALKNVRRVLADVQAIDTGHPAVDEVLEAVAASLGKVNSLAKGRTGGQASIPPPAEPAAPRPVAAPVSAAQPDPIAAQTPTIPRPAAVVQQPAPAPVPQPVVQAKPAPAPAPAPVPQPVVQAKPAPAPAPAPVPQPVVQAKPAPAPVPQPVVQAKPAPAPAPAPVAQPAPIVQPKPAPAPAPVAQPAPVVQPQPIVAVQTAPAPAPQPVVQAKPAPAPAPQAAPAPVAAPAPAAPEKALPKKVPAPAAPPGVRTIEVALGTRSVSNFYKGLSGNEVVEHGGLFVETYRIPKIGEQVQLHVIMPGDYEFYALANVVWTREVGGSSEPGFGARFTQIGADGRQLVYRYTRNREPMFYDDL